MEFIELTLMALALAMDAFAVSLGKGLATKEIRTKHTLITGAWFGSFQALMPLIGYFLGRAFSSYIISFDHWIAFALLAYIGVNMIREAFSCDDEEQNSCFSMGVMLTMAIATSIDALAAGISLAMDEANIWLAILLIGVITFITSAVGVKIGNVFGSKYSFAAQLGGGVVLVLMGVKILLEHLEVISF